MELLYLTYLATVIILGLLTSIVSNKLKIPNVFLLLLVGISLKNITYLGQPLIDFPVIFISTISIVALILLLFDSTSRLSIKELDIFSGKTLAVTVLFLVFNLVFLSMLTNWMFNLNSVFMSVLFAALMSGTSPDTVIATTQGFKHKTIEFLKIESIINTPIIVLIPFLMIDLLQSVETINFTTFVEQIAPFLQQIITGVGAGIVIGLVVFKFMRKYYSQTLSPLSVVGAAILSYVLAENLGGNGVLAVTACGVLFANIYIKHKLKLEEFSLEFSTFLEILVFILVGLLINIPNEPAFFFKSLGLFLALVLIRVAAVLISMWKVDYLFKEKMFIALNAPKGIAVAVMAATFYAFTVPGSANYIPNMDIILNLTLMFLIYSIIVSTVVSKFKGYFVKEMR